MESDPRPDQSHERPGVRLFEISVYLTNPGTSPNLVNPDFLRHNNIVDPTWLIVRPVMMEHGFSRIRYSNGLSLSAHNEQIVVTQLADMNSEEGSITPLTSQNIVCFKVAKQYLQSVSPEPPYELVSIDPKVLMEMRFDGDYNGASPLRRLAMRIPFNEVVPEVQTRAQYRLPDKNITVYASELISENTDEVNHLMFSGEIIRQVVGDSDREAQVSFINGVLDQWEQDVEDFIELAQLFYSLYVQCER